MAQRLVEVAVNMVARDEVVSVDVLAVSLAFDSRASEESLACS